MSLGLRAVSAIGSFLFYQRFFCAGSKGARCVRPAGGRDGCARRGSARFG